MNKINNWSTDKLVGAGLVLALFLIIILDTVITIDSGTIPSRELAGNIVSGLIGYIGRNLIDDKKQGGEVK